MTFEKILSDVSMDLISLKAAYEEMQKPDKIKRINYYAHMTDITKEPMTDSQLQELEAIVDILQVLYTSEVGSPVSDSTYDTLQEMLIDMGIPRLTGSIEINDNKKVSHVYKTLRGTLDKVYYLTNDEKRTNKSRKYLDEILKPLEIKYEKATGKHLDFNTVKIMLQPKFDGVSACLEYDKNKALWLTRGDTKNNRASDATPIMSQFNSIFCGEEEAGMKFEVMITEENLAMINKLMSGKPYHNSRQVVISTMNSNEPDFKAEYIYPVPLRIIHPGEEVEQIHPMLIEKFPTKICTFGDRDIIREFANKNRYVEFMGMHFRTDGCVMTILDPEIQKILGRDNDINHFEVAYKFTEETAISKVKKVEFYVSEFGYITPVLVVNDVILKGNTVNHISLSNKERFDELGLCYGDEVKILYDIIPYATIDGSCKRVPNGRKIEFVKVCPQCHQPLELNAVQVQCKNPECPSRIVGKIINYCRSVRIQNIGGRTLQILYDADLLKNGIRSLYKLKKHSLEIENLDGFGRLKTRKIINEIEAKRRLKDYEFFGALGIEGISTKSFQQIFSVIPLSEFLDMLKLKNFDLMKEKLLAMRSIGYIKTGELIDYFKDTATRTELMKILKEVVLHETYSVNAQPKIKVIFTGCRPDDDMATMLENHGYEPVSGWNNAAKYVVIPHDGYESEKVNKARAKNIPIILLENITKSIPNLI